MLTKGYRLMLEEMHRDPDLKWGNDGKHHADAVVRIAQRVGAKTILDFGCGRSTLSKALKAAGHKFKCTDYDPGRPKKATLPNEVFDMVVCTDVLEHVEPEHVDSVIAAIAARTGKAAYFVIDTVPAVTKLPDGRNAHLTVREAVWWLGKLNAAFPVHMWHGLQETQPKKLIAEYWTRE
jgi:2-polyprenyl-3-methyl-5-hydroxy-6-metoxy-1,4-benzoquinol methylase